MTDTTLAPLSEAARRLVNLYGRGSVREVRLYLDGKVTVECVSPYMKPHTYRGRLNNGTLYLVRHQIRIS